MVVERDFSPNCLNGGTGRTSFVAGFELELWLEGGLSGRLVGCTGPLTLLPVTTCDAIVVGMDVDVEIVVVAVEVVVPTTPEFTIFLKACFSNIVEWPRVVCLLDGGALAGCAAVTGVVVVAKAVVEG